MRSDDDYDNDIAGEGRRPGVLTILFTLMAVGAAGVVLYASWSRNDASRASGAEAISPSSLAEPAEPSIALGKTTAEATASLSPSSAAPAVSASTSTEATSAHHRPSASSSTSTTAIDAATPTTSLAAASPAATSTTAPDTAATLPTLPTVPPGTPYPTEADGTARPIVVIFDTGTITLTGEVPTQEAADRLAMLAAANSQGPAYVINNMIINPSVPIGVGVRAIELNSPRFPEASSTVLPAHAAQLDRVATVLKALPNVTVLVVGHADQRGSDTANYAISDARARAVVNYLVYVGTAPARLSSRAVGEADLLAAGDDATSLALNRRTEFIFYGLLIP